MRNACNCVYQKQVFDTIKVLYEQPNFNREKAPQHYINQYSIDQIFSKDKPNIVLRPRLTEQTLFFQPRQVDMQ